MIPNPVFPYHLSQRIAAVSDQFASRTYITHLNVDESHVAWAMHAPQKLMDVLVSTMASILPAPARSGSSVLRVHHSYRHEDVVTALSQAMRLMHILLSSVAPHADTSLEGRPPTLLNWCANTATAQYRPIFCDPYPGLFW